MMMTLGMFVFSLDTAAYQELQRQTEWRHPETSRIGALPARQYLGPGADTVQITGVLYPQLTGGQESLDELREMANEGKAWPLIEGTGRMYGFYAITALSETGQAHLRDGAAQRIEFQLSLARVDEERRAQIGMLMPGRLMQMLGALA